MYELQNHFMKENYYFPHTFQNKIIFYISISLIISYPHEHEANMCAGFHCGHHIIEYPNNLLQQEIV